MTRVEIALPGQAGADALAVPVAQPLGGDDAKIVDDRLGGKLRKLGESGDLRGERGEAVLLHLDGELEAPRLVAAGVGQRDQVDPDALRTAGAATAQALSRVGGTLVWLLDESLPVPLPEQAAALVEGTILGAYSPGHWKSRHETKAPTRIVVGHADDPELQKAVERAAIVSERANRSRDLSNMPPNELTPHTLGEKAQELAREHEHLTCEVLATKELDDLGMGALTAVGRGSRNEPRLIVLRYDPPGARDDIVLGLVGKSITFDAGGISIKPSGGMQDMKGDMSGGAGTLHGIGALAALGTPVRAIAALAAAENLPGGDAFRPGDILRAANGKTIEVINTDAEGRLVLADALWYVRREGATHVLDLATLTGAMELALGDLYAGGFGGVDRWDGTRWSSMGLEGTEVEALGLYGDKLIIAGLSGVDRFAPGSTGIVSWDGERWGGFGTGVNGMIYALQQVGGDLYAAGCFSYAGDQPSFSIARWGGSEPQPSPKPPSADPPPAAGGIAVSPVFVTSDRALLSYSLPAAGQACLELFDTRGARVATLCDRVAGSGTNVLTWSPGSPAPFPQNGVYFLRLTAQGRTAHAKVIFSR